MEIICKTPYEKVVREYAKEFGGFFNAHAHIDRAFTFKDEYYSHKDKSVSEVERMTLSEKQKLVWALHTGSAFEEECIEERMRRVLDDSIEYGTRRVDSAIDVTYNTKLKGWEIARKLKKEYSEKGLEFNIGVYNVSGFKDKRKVSYGDIKKAEERFNLFEEAAKTADFIVALAEKDNVDLHPEHIGEMQHNVYMLELGLKLGKPVHFHIGQANHPDDRGDDLLFEAMNWVYEMEHRLSESKYPRNFLVHDISAACYNEEDFKRHCENIKKFNTGVISCPSAGISMKRNSVLTPTHNSLARVWDYVVREIPVYIGTDNINDVFVPSSTPDMYDEVAGASNILRFYNQRILAKLACGVGLDNFDRSKISGALFNNH